MNYQYLLFEKQWGKWVEVPPSRRWPAQQTDVMTSSSDESKAIIMMHSHYLPVFKSDNKNGVK